MLVCWKTSRMRLVGGENASCQLFWGETKKPQLIPQSRRARLSAVPIISQSCFDWGNSSHNVPLFLRIPHFPLIFLVPDRSKLAQASYQPCLQTLEAFWGLNCMISRHYGYPLFMRRLTKYFQRGTRYNHLPIGVHTFLP